jgi:hypothetical protein
MKQKYAPENISDDEMDMQFGGEDDTSFDDYDEYSDGIDQIDADELQTLTSDE